MKNIIKKTILSTGLLSGGMLFAQVVGINTTTPQSTLEVNHKQESNTDYLLKVQDNAKTLEIFNIKASGTQAGIGSLSNVAGFSNSNAILSLYSNSNRDRLKIEVPENGDLATLRFASGGATMGDLGYRKINNVESVGFFGENAYSVYSGVGYVGINLTSNNDEESGKGVYSSRRIDLRNVESSNYRRSRMDENGKWIFSNLEDTQNEKKERLTLQSALHISTPANVYTNISHNATTPVPKGGAGTIVFQQSDKKLYGYNGTEWKLLSNE